MENILAKQLHPVALFYFKLKRPTKDERGAKA